MNIKKPGEQRLTNDEFFLSFSFLFLIVKTFYKTENKSERRADVFEDVYLCQKIK